MSRAIIPALPFTRYHSHIMIPAFSPISGAVMSTPETTNPPSTQGQCHCGKVRFSMRFPSKSVVHCHCTRCRSFHAAAFVTWVCALTDQVDIHDPEQALRWFESGNNARRGFCGHCGSSMLFTGDDWPGEVHMARALFTGPLDRQPQAHVFYDTHVDWVSVGDDLPKKPDPALRKAGRGQSGAS
jgi:hypothetical protein